MDFEDYEPPLLPPNDEELWRTPKHLFDVATKPDDYYKDYVAVGDLYNICLYKIQRAGPYVTQHDNVQVEETGLSYRSEQQLIGVSLDKKLVVATADGQLVILEYMNGFQELWRKCFDFPVCFVQQIFGNVVFSSGRKIYVVSAERELQIAMSLDWEISHLRAIQSGYVVQTTRERSGQGPRFDTVVQFSSKQIKLAALPNKEITASQQSTLIPELVVLGLEDGSACLVDLRHPLVVAQKWEISATKLTSAFFSESHQDCLFLAAADGETRLVRFIFRPLTLADFNEFRIQYAFSLKRDEEFDLLAREEDSQAHAQKAADGAGMFAGLASAKIGSKASQGRLFHEGGTQEAQAAPGGICGAFADSACLLSAIFITDGGQIALWLLKSSPATQRWLSALAKHYFSPGESVCSENTLQERVQLKMYQRDLSGVLQEVFETVQSLLRQDKLAEAESSFKQFDKCVAYLKAKQMQPPALREDLDLREYLRELFKRIPIGLPGRFCIRPTDPDALQHRQLALLLQLKKTLQSGESLSLKPVETFYNFCKENPQLVLRALPETLMECALRFQQRNCTAASVALRLLQLLPDAGGLESVFFRPVLPSIFQESFLEETPLFQHFLASVQRRADAEDPGILWGVYRVQQCGKSTSSEPLQKLFGTPKNPQYMQYLKLLQSLQADFLQGDFLIEELNINDLFPQNFLIIDQATYLITAARHWAANDTDAMAKLISTTAAAIRKQFQSTLVNFQNQQRLSLKDEMLCFPVGTIPKGEKSLGPHGFYYTVAFMAQLFWEKYIWLFHERLDGYLDLDVGKQFLDGLCFLVKDQFLAFCLGENQLTAMRGRQSQQDEVAGIFKQLLETMKQFKNQIEADWVVLTTKVLQDCLKTVEPLGLKSIADEILEILAFLRK